MYYPNQKQISIIRESVEKSKTNGRLYIIAYQDNLIEAMNCLTPAAFKVYVCLLFNKDGYKIEFSPEHLSKLTGLCKDTVRKSIAQLIRCGYIEEQSTTRLVFNEKRAPQPDGGTTNKYDEIKVIKNWDGFDVISTFRQVEERYGYERAEEIWARGSV